MSDDASILLGLFLPVVALWAVTTVLVTLAMLHLTGRVRDAGLPRLAPEMWGAVAASGAAGGGVLGFGVVAPALALGADQGAFDALLLVTAAGMLLGAAATAGLVLLVVWLWTGGA